MARDVDTAIDLANIPAAERASELGATSEATGAGDCEATDLSIAQLVAEVYEQAPPAERGRLLEILLRPLGLLSLFGIAGGVFAKLRLQGGWQQLQLRLEDIQAVRAGDVAALVEHAQQVSVEAVDGLAQALAVSSLMSSSAAAVLLVTLLLRRAYLRQSAS